MITEERYMTTEKGPVRTCAGCRQRDDKDALLRFVVRDEEPRLVPDIRHRLPGRGVYVHPTRECVRLALQKGGFSRSVRTHVSGDPDEVCALAAAQYERRAEGLLLAAFRNGCVALGTDPVRRALGEATVRLLVVAVDAAGRRDELVAQAARLGEDRCVRYGTKETLGRLFSRSELGVLGILDERIAKEVAATTARATQLSEDCQ